jgi:transcriptional regulator with XRE-family HTH domain
MDAVRFGRQFRALRMRKDLRQEDVGAIARPSRSLVSMIDRGLVEHVAVGTLVRAAAALGASVDIRLRWNGEQLDRLLDEAHAHLVDLVVVALRATGWEVAVEVSFSIWGERGSIDIFAFHRLTGIVLVVEVKSVVPDNQSTFHGLDRKARLAPQLAEERGWECRASRGCSLSGRLPHRGAASPAWAGHTAQRFPCREVTFGGGCATQGGRSPGSCSSHMPRGMALSTDPPLASASGAGRPLECLLLAVVAYERTANGQRG